MVIVTEEKYFVDLLKDDCSTKFVKLQLLIRNKYTEKSSAFEEKLVYIALAHF